MDPQLVVFDVYACAIKVREEFIARLTWFHEARLEGFVSAFARADSNGLFDRRNENLAVANTTGLRRVADRLDRLVGKLVWDNDLDFDLGQEINDVFGASVEFGMALLTPETLGLRHRDALQPNFLKGLFDLIELEGFDDGLNLFHVHVS
eukprot:jgi/Tetstr1/450795/TSEL_037831.t1